MKTIIAGTRTATRYNTQSAIVRCPFIMQISEVVTGGNKVVQPTGAVTGADWWGEQWAEAVSIKVTRFAADNCHITDYADALILVWDGKSRGSRDMLKKARAKGLTCFVWDYVKMREVTE
ncbi:MAG: hypothetical protein KDK05_03840 [Candidatus Competibacteraceae bacterium]|nr:hypothetical protein [Candidatus Competibacteraceae bacterium]